MYLQVHVRQRHSKRPQSYTMSLWLLTLYTILIIIGDQKVNSIQNYSNFIQFTSQKFIQNSNNNNNTCFNQNATTSNYLDKSELINKNNIFIIDLWNKFPVNFIPKTINENANLCGKQSALFRSALKNSEMWALKMFDSSAKLPSGILNGNINQFGDFDQCLSIHKELPSEKEDVYGKYCLANVQFTLTYPSEYMKEIDSLIHSHYIIKSNISDFGHRVPRFSSISWGICLPSGCTSQHLQNEMYQELQKTFPTNVEIAVKIDEKMCSTSRKHKAIHDKFELSLGFLISGILFGILFVLTILGMFIDVNQENDSKLLKFIKCFSLHKNITQLTKIDSRDEIRSVHGLRCLNAIALLLVHKSMALLYSPYINRTAMTENLGLPWSIIGRSAIVYTDSFILLSGLLNGHAFLKELQASGNINFVKKIIARIFRMLPSMAALILFCTYFLPNLPFLSSGPLWPQVINVHSELCKQNMWRNFLFIHNYFGFENMCLTHTHQIGMDMQLFLLCPIFVYLLWKNMKYGLYLMAGVATASTILRGWAGYYYNLAPIVFNGVKLQQLFDTANYSYILPTHRITIYLFGILAAYVLNKNRKIAFTSFQVRFFWTLGALFALTTVIGPYPLATKAYVYSPVHAAWYNAISPIVWGLFIFWGLIAINNGNGGWFGNFMDWNKFQIFSRIAYSFYLTQFPIFFYNIGRRRNSETFKSHMLVEPCEVAFIILFSIALTLFVEMPFINIHRLLCGSESSKDKRKILESDVSQGDEKKLQ